MKQDSTPTAPAPDADEQVPALHYTFGLNRRAFTQTLGAGLLLAVGGAPALAQRSRNRSEGGGERRLAARIHLGENGIVTVMTGKVELGQGARAELTQAAAEELRVRPGQVQMIMADTGLVPDDGITAGSRTTPSTLPAVRQGAAAARNLLVELACQRWGVERDTVEVRDGKISHAATQRALTYAELARSAETAKAFEQAVPAEVTLTPVKEWKVLGTSLPRTNGRDLVTGAHLFPSDMARPGMLYGKVLRPPSFNARLTAIDLAPAKAMKDVVVAREGDFAGVAAPTSWLARQALEALAKTAVWEPVPQPSSQELYSYLKAHAQEKEVKNPFADELAGAAKVLRGEYHAAYVQHAPLEPRTALAEWHEGSLTVWTSTQAPFGYQGELARTFRVSNERVRVIVPDTGSGFGGKHTGEAAVEAARLAQAAKRPVLVRWTREEEFTWAYFRPAAVIEIEAGLDAKGSATSWHFVNINSGGAAIDTPYRIGKARSRFIGSSAPLRQGSYRALAATVNTFAREGFKDELAAAAGADPLQFRLAHLDRPRLRDVLAAAAKRFDWAGYKKKKPAGAGIGLACGTEKGSYVAACVEVSVDPQQRRFEVRRVCQVFECGKVLNPDNLLAQVQGCILMGLGAALREEIQFEQGRILNPNFSGYQVPRFRDVPALDIHLLDRPDLPSAGGGETPIIAIAPAIANAIFDATGIRLRELPLRLPEKI